MTNTKTLSRTKKYEVHYKINGKKFWKNDIFAKTPEKAEQKLVDLIFHKNGRMAEILHVQLAEPILFVVS